MSNQPRTVQMHLINPGSTEADGDFAFELTPRVDSGRIVRFALQPRDAEDLHRKLGEYLASKSK